MLDTFHIVKLAGDALDEARRVVGWVSERDLVDRMYRDQRRAIEARTQTSWGSRMQERRRSR